MKAGDEYVFPQDLPVKSPTKTADFHRFGGMTLRDYFAGQMLAGIFASYSYLETVTSFGGVAKNCYVMADAMLRVRNETGKD